MKKLLALLLVISLSVSLCACGKSTEAAKADELILAIGDVTVDSEAAILVAQAYYDTLTDAQKAEVEYYDVLVNAQELLPQKIIEAHHNDVVTLIEQGDFLQASSILFENPEISDYAELMKQCGQGVLPQYIQENGDEKEPGKYFLNLVNADGTQISVWYFADNNAIQLLYYSSGSGTAEAVMIDYIMGDSGMTFTRSTMNLGTPVNYQEGTINVSEYTGKYTGSLAENSSDPLVIVGLTVTKAQTVYAKQTRGYHVATMSFVNEMLDALFGAVVDAGYKGTVSDIGFVMYKTE